MQRTLSGARPSAEPFDIAKHFHYVPWTRNGLRHREMRIPLAKKGAGSHGVRILLDMWMIRDWVVEQDGRFFATTGEKPATDAEYFLAKLIENLPEDCDRDVAFDMSFVSEAFGYKTEKTAVAKLGMVIKAGFVKRKQPRVFEFSKRAKQMEVTTGASAEIDRVSDEEKVTLKDSEEVERIEKAMMR